MTLSPQDIEWVAKLSRLDLTQEEMSQMTGQLNDIVDYVAQLQQIDTEGVEPLAHPLPVNNVFRKDEPDESLDVDVALQNAPKRKDGFFSVPPVLE